MIKNQVIETECEMHFDGAILGHFGKLVTAQC